ncbi:MFS transporter [Sodalis glossinidius]|uniref:MFS transporter n=1 Tax=Sodalis glossinidius TaxID=63612 RepID=UPI0002D50BF7|nr:MFS transporter [Sodalis glossinidius]
MFTTWRAVFAIMLGYALLTMATLWLMTHETLNRRAPLRLLTTFDHYYRLLMQRHFVLPALSIGSGVGGIYTLSIALPFVLIYRLRLSTFSFGLVMMFQTGSYITGSLLANRLLRLHSLTSIIRLGVSVIALGGILFLLLPHLCVPAVWVWISPAAIWVFGNALVAPGLTSFAMERQAEKAGSASALLGFIQIGIGFLDNTLLGSFYTDVAQGTAWLVPMSAFIAVSCGLASKRA